MGKISSGKEPPPGSNGPRSTANQAVPTTIQEDEKVERRRIRVERKLQELEEEEPSKTNVQVENGDLNGTGIGESGENGFHDLIEFAEQYFNNFERTTDSGNVIIQTLTRSKKGKPVGENILPKYEMVTYTSKSTIMNSHVHLYDPDNVHVSCLIFRDMNKYMKGELKLEQEIQVIQAVVGYGIEREELRDEIYVQLMRQCTNNPNVEYLERLWLIFCLCVVSFPPGKLLHKYVISFLRKNLETTRINNENVTSVSSEKLQQQMQWCLENCYRTQKASSCRRLPASCVEISVSFWNKFACEIFI